MRIIIEIDEKAETTEVREAVESREETSEEATDAGEAPRSRSPIAEETVGPGPAPAEPPERPGQATDAGSAPESLPEPPTGSETGVPGTTSATDAGSAPGRMEGPRSTGGSIAGGGSPGRAPVTTPTEVTDAGPPPGFQEEGSGTGADTAIDYEAIVSGTIEEVKDRVEGGDLDVSRVIEAERSGNARSTLLDWLERRKQ